MELMIILILEIQLILIFPTLLFLLAATESNGPMDVMGQFCSPQDGECESSDIRIALNGSQVDGGCGFEGLTFKSPAFFATAPFSSVYETSLECYNTSTISLIVQEIEILASATEICAGESVDLSVSGSGSIGLPTHLFNDTELFGPFFNEDVLVNFSNPNSNGILKFDLYIHDSWDGSSGEDYLMVYLDDTEVFNYSFNNHLGQNNSQTYPTGNLDNISTQGSLINNLPRLFTDCSTGGSSHRTSLYEIEIPFNQVFSTIKFKSTISGSPPLCLITDESYSLDNISFNDSSNDSSTYLWSTGETTEMISVSPSETTEYWVDVTTNGVTCREYITINVINPEITASATEICVGESVDLSVNNIDFEQIEINTGIIEYNFDAVNGLPIEGFQLLGEYNNHYYYKYNTPTSWLDADTLTRANGGYLACLDNQNENDFVWNSFGGNKWIGYYDSNGQENNLWVNGQPSTYENWRNSTNEPNTQPGEPYTMMSICFFGSSGNWVDLANISNNNGSCYSDVFPVMEVDPSIFSSSTFLLWSTGETTENITITPTETTEYWVDVTTNGVTCRDYITINVDAEDPTWIFPPSDLTVECDGAGNTTEFNNWLNNTFSGIDNCGSVTITTNSTGLSDDCGATGSETVTFTLTDSNNNAITLDATFTIVDTTDPTIDLAATDTTVACDGSTDPGDAFQTWLDNNGGAIASDLCSSSTLPTDGLIGYWPFNGDANDESGNENHGTVSDAILSTDRFGSNNSSYAFDGSTSKIYFSLNSIGNLIPAGPMSTSLWVKTSDLKGPLISMRPEIPEAHLYNFMIGTLRDTEVSPGNYGIFIRDINNSEKSQFGSNVVDNSWQMLTIVSEANGNVHLYKNGNLEASVSGNNGELNFSPNFMTFGAEEYWIVGDQSGNCNSCNTVEEQYLNGQLDDIAIWNRALSTEEINNLYLGNSDTVTWTNNSIGLSDDCGATGSETVIFTATDVCGNASTTSATFTIEDTTPPTIDVEASDLIVECDGAGNTAELNAWLDSIGTTGCSF